MGSNISKDVEEVGQGVNVINNKERHGGNTIMFTSRTGAVTGAGVVPGVVGTVEEVLNNLVGSADVELVNVVKLGPRSGGKGRGGDSSGSEQRR